MPEGSVDSQPSPKPKEGPKRLGRFATLATSVSLALAACTPGGQATHESATPIDRPPAAAQGADTATTTASQDTLSPEDRQLALAEVNTFALTTAGRILELSTDPNRDVNTYRGPGNFIAVNVMDTAPSALGGQFGEYGLIASGKQDANGNLDLTKINEILIFAQVNKSGQERATSSEDRHNVFAFSLSRNSADNNWMMTTSYGNNTNNGQDQRVFDTTEGFHSDVIPPLTSHVFSPYAEQAREVFANAVNRAPVNTIPPVPHG